MEVVKLKLRVCEVHVFGTWHVARGTWYPSWLTRLALLLEPTVDKPRAPLRPVQGRHGFRLGLAQYMCTYCPAPRPPAAKCLPSHVFAKPSIVVKYGTHSIRKCLQVGLSRSKAIGGGVSAKRNGCTLAALRRLVGRSPHLHTLDISGAGVLPFACICVSRVCRTRLWP